MSRSRSLLLRWSPLLLLSLLVACSPSNSPQADSSQNDRTIEAPVETAQTTSTPSPSVSPANSSTNSSTLKPGNSSQAASSSNTPSPANSLDSSDSQTKPDSQPAKPDRAKSPQPRSAPASSVASRDLLQPTYRAEQRMAGFSTDGNHYIYLESSRDTGAGIPKSSVQVVNIAANACAATGCQETRYGEEDSQLEMAEAENTLLKQTWKVRQQLKLTPPVAGQPLAIVARSRTADGTETLTVRLSDRNQPLQLRLRQAYIPSTINGGQAERDQAAMQLEVTYNGQRRSLDSLKNYRNWVLGYSIREVRLSPDGRHVAVLITATKPTFEGTLGTTIVQGFEL